MNSKKYLFIISQPLCHRNRKRWGVDFLNDSGALAGVIDLTKILHPETYREFGKRGGVVEASGINYISPNGYLDLIRFIRNAGEVDYAFDRVNGSLISTFLRCYLRLKKVKFVGLSGALYPVSKKNDQKSHFFDILKKLRHIKKPNKIINRILKFFEGKFIGDDYYVITGLEAEKRNPNKSAKKIFCHAYDFDLFLFEQFPFDGPKKYIVFIDEDEAGHVDYLTLDYLPSVTVENYFSSLNMFFSLLEKKYNIPVLIAEHPRAYYSPVQKENFYYGRVVVHGKTLDLIKNAALVISHSSTSIGMAVLFERPIILLATKEITRNKKRFSEIQDFSEELGLDIVNADSLTSLEDFKVRFNINSVLYQDYINKYLKHPKSPDGIYSWEIIMNALEGS